MKVPYFRPAIGADDLAAVASVLRSGWLTTGPVARDFEREFCRVTGASHAIAVNSCTNGLHAALIAHGVKSGDEVITTPMTFCGTVRAIEEADATPVFVDIAHNLNLDASQLQCAVTPRTRAIVPVHMAGLPSDLSVIWQVAREQRLEVIEDAAHAFGAAWNEQPIGSSGVSTAVFSLYANKNLTAGEGGMITTQDAELAARIRRVVGLGLERASNQAEDRWRYEVVERGFKYNLSDILAAVGLAQLSKWNEAARLRGEVAEYYNETLAGIGEIELPPVDVRARHAWHLFIIRLHLHQLTVSRDEFIARLGARGVSCSVHFRPIPMHRWFAHYGPMGRWPCAAREFPRLISLPIYPALSPAEREYVVRQIGAVISECRKPQFALAHEVSP